MLNKFGKMTRKFVFMGRSVRVCRPVWPGAGLPSQRSTTRRGAFLRVFLRNQKAGENNIDEVKYLVDSLEEIITKMRK